MKVDNEIKKIIKNQFSDWEQTSQGDWERYIKGSKTREINNTYENKERNLLLKESIKEDRGGGSENFYCIYKIYKGTLLLNKDGIRESEHCKKENSLVFDCFEDGDNWYDGLWRMGIVDGEGVVKSYVQKCNDEIEIYQSKIKEIENNIKEFNN
jgi:hypothetical protein